MANRHYSSDPICTIRRQTHSRMNAVRSANSFLTPNPRVTRITVRLNDGLPSMPSGGTFTIRAIERTIARIVGTARHGIYPWNESRHSSLNDGLPTEDLVSTALRNVCAYRGSGRTSPNEPPHYERW